MSALKSGLVTEKKVVSDKLCNCGQCQNPGWAMLRNVVKYHIVGIFYFNFINFGIFHKNNFQHFHFCVYAHASGEVFD